jgi:hypothetical protein
MSIWQYKGILDSHSRFSILGRLFNAMISSGSVARVFLEDESMV